MHAASIVLCIHGFSCMDAWPSGFSCSLCHVSCFDRLYSHVCSSVYVSELFCCCCCVLSALFLLSAAVCWPAVWHRLLGREKGRGASSSCSEPEREQGVQQVACSWLAHWADACHGQCSNGMNSDPSRSYVAQGLQSCTGFYPAVSSGQNSHGSNSTAVSSGSVLIEYLKAVAAGDTREGQGGS